MNDEQVAITWTCLSMTAALSMFILLGAVMAKYLDGPGRSGGRMMPIDKEVVWSELLWREAESMRDQRRKVRKRTVVGFWAALAFIVAFILGCWVVS